MKFAAHLIFACCLMLSPACGGAESVESDQEEPAPEGDGMPTAAWAEVLSRYQSEGGIDYEGLQTDRELLDRYLASLDSAEPELWEESRQIAFWINSYNAVVIHHVLDLYPNIESVKDVSGFFDELEYPVAGELLSLDEIENRAREFGDPRVHFAVVCASTSCPDLRWEPYGSEDLQAQLSSQTELFLSDKSKGLYLDAETGEIWLSSIFKWYAGDFTGGSTVVAFFARGGVLDWVLEQLPEEDSERIRPIDPSIRYLDYHWSLNNREGR